MKKTILTMMFSIFLLTCGETTNKNVENTKDGSKIEEKLEKSSLPSLKIQEGEKVLVVVGHPDIDNSSSNKALLEAIEGQKNITTHVLSKKYPDFNYDIEAEKQIVRDHDVIVIQTPIHWAGLPYQVDKWLEQISEFGNDQYKGKKIMIVATSGAPQGAYNQDIFDGIKSHLESIEMIYHEPIFFGGVQNPSFSGQKTPSEELQKQISTNVETYKKLLNIK